VVGVRAKDALGQYGERVAARHLRAAGLTIVATNWRCKDGEIDIVARERGVVVICEVKTRRTDAFGTPAEAVTRTKADRLRRLAMLWLREHPVGGQADVRFDVVSVLLPRAGRPAVEHLRGAF
jgi:putative endonuclease